MKWTEKLTVATTLLFVTCLVGPAAAADGPSPRSELARTDIHTRSIAWQPMIDFESAKLTIAGPGDFVYQKEYARGTTIYLAMDPKNTDILVDGQYAYELRFEPKIAPEVREALKAARESGTMELPEALKDKLPEDNLVKTGYFRILNGSMVTPDVAEKDSDSGISGEREENGSSENPSSAGEADLATKDQVILDDLIVDGSACIGQDCVNGESFGFDTIRIKENNLRIKAQDTSTSGSFPTNDWQITFNDSANGGANKFSIDDIDGGRTPFTIEASAPSHSLYVDDGGRLGLGTSTPVVDVHTVNGNTPTLRLEQDGSSGFTAQTWDVAGNEANFFVRDATNGSKLPFKIKPSAPTDSLYVAASGNVGLGTASPSAPLHVSVASEDPVGPGNSTLVIERPGELAIQLKDTTDSNFWQISNALTNDKMRFSRSGTSNVEMELDSDGTLTVLTAIVVGATPIDVPDYVFAEDYNLMSIPKLDEFVQTEGHLPGIPSAQEINTSGLNMTEMQIHLLKKIEELTLYAIQQHKLINQLEERLSKTEVLQSQ